MLLRYKGTSDVRSFVKNDFTRHLGEDTEAKAVHFDAKNDFTAEVPDDVGQWLLDNEGGEFVKADEASKAEAAKADAKIEAAKVDDSEEIATGGVSPGPITTAAGNRSGGGSVRS